MATFVTRVDQPQGLTGSPEQRLQTTPDGTLWLMVVDEDRARFFSSRGGSWEYAAGSDLDLLIRQAYPSWRLDESGNAYVSWVNTWADPQTVKLARGRPRSGGGWSWTTLTISPAEGRMNSDTTLQVWRAGSGWTVFVSWHNDSGPATGARVSRVSVSPTGTMKVTAVLAGPPATGGNLPLSALDFAHTGDGVTPAPAPHLFLVAGARFNDQPLRAYRARYESGNYTWETPVVLDAGVMIPNTTMASVWDGERLCVAWQVASTSVVRFAEWGGTGAVIRRDPPALPSGLGAIMGAALSHDPASDDLYLAVYDATDGDVRYSKLTRAAGTWSAWAIAATRNGGGGDGKLHLARQAPRTSVDMVYGNPLGGERYDVLYAQLAALVRAPNAPTLLAPSSGARLDLASGAAFTWRYAPVGPSDAQQAYVLRRSYANGTTTVTEYWNAAAQGWSATVVWNASGAGQATFGPGKWTTGGVYTWAVRTRSVTGGDSDWSTTRTVTATVAPVVAVTGPVGIAYGESTPLVSWTFTATEAQRDYQVRIVPVGGAIDPANPGPVAWSSGVVASAIAREHRVEKALDSSVAYRAYVQATSVSGAQSAWAYSGFVLSIDPPTGPVVEAVDEVSYDSDVPRVKLNVLARSNFLSAAQAVGYSGWEPLVRSTLAALPADDDATGVQAGFSMTSTDVGLWSARTVPGSPPVAPYGQPQPLGPLTFPVLGGAQYTALASFRMAAALRAARVSVEWYDADDGTGQLISISTGEQVVADVTVYTQATVTAFAPRLAAMGRMVVEVLGALAAGEVAYVTQLSVHPGVDRTWQTGGYVGTQLVRVERSDDAGVTWSTLIQRIKPDLRQRAQARDRLMPYNRDVLYRARTDVDTGAGSVLSSALSPTATTYVDSSLWAVRDPDDPGGEMNAYVTGHKRSDAEAATVSRPAGREYPVIDSEGLQSFEGTLTLYVPGPQVERAVELLRRPVPLIVQSPAGSILRVRMLRRDYTPGAVRAREIEVPYVEVEA